MRMEPLSLILCKRRLLDEKRTKNILKVVLGIFLLLLLVGFFISTYTIYYGWVEITDKNIVENEYHLSGNLLDKEPIEIVTDATDTFTYEQKPQETNEVKISQVWDSIETEETHFFRIKTNNYKSTYKIEKLYGY